MTDVKGEVSLLGNDHRGNAQRQRTSLLEPSAAHLLSSCCERAATPDFFGTVVTQRRLGGEPDLEQQKPQRASLEREMHEHLEDGQSSRLRCVDDGVARGIPTATVLLRAFAREGILSMTFLRDAIADAQS